MSQVRLEYGDDRCWRLMESPDGLRQNERQVGPAYTNGAEARYWMDTYLTIPHVSPLRASGEGSTGRTAAVALTAEPSPDVRSASPLPGGKG